MILAGPLFYFNSANFFFGMLIVSTILKFNELFTCRVSPPNV